MTDRNLDGISLGSKALELGRISLLAVLTDIGYGLTGDISPISTTGGNNKIVKTDASGNAVLTGRLAADEVKSGKGILVQDTGTPQTVFTGLIQSYSETNKLRLSYPGVADSNFQTDSSGVLNLMGMVDVTAPSLTLTGGLTAGGGYISLQEITTPSATANYGKIYTKTDNKLYVQTGDGVEHQIAFV